LSGRGQFADLIQKEGALIGALEPSPAGAHGACEAAFLVPEQLGVDEVGRDGATVDPHEGTGGPCRTRVDGAGKDFFSHAGFPLDLVLIKCLPAGVGQAREVFMSRKHCRKAHGETAEEHGAGDADPGILVNTDWVAKYLSDPKGCIVK
jgi:hypothetical protein